MTVHPACRALMFQGTGSSVGKSVLVAGLARLLTRRGLRVRPFKPQNMSNNAAVTPEGGEIGRAQALQALACGTAPSVDMNPVLLKPHSLTGSQLVVCGQVRGQIRAKAYQTIKASLMPDVLAAYNRLAADADIVLVEGAGSASEVNLRAHDIANMGFAQAADIDVVLVGDIDRGGVIASLVGTRAVLPDQDAHRIKSFIVNRMRGDASLFEAGMARIVAETGWTRAGLVTHCEHVRALPSEDAADLESSATSEGAGTIRIAVPLCPMIANFDDLDPLKGIAGVHLDFVTRGRPLPVADLVVLPGSKSTIADLSVFRAEGWDIDLHAHIRRGGYVLGLCGGYQMLGQTLSDPHAVEGGRSTVDGLGFLQVRTEIGLHKRLARVRGVLMPEQVALDGYEMHMGHTTGPDCQRPFSLIEGHPEGAVAGNGRIWGTYLHGFLSQRSVCKAFLERLGARDIAVMDHGARVEAALDAWADHLETCLDVEALLRLAKPVNTADSRSRASL